MVAGNFEVKIPTLSGYDMLSVSTVVTGENHGLQSAEPSECLIIPLSFESSPIQIALITRS
jgi:CheY-specific phosphatase CheX